MLLFEDSPRRKLKAYNNDYEFRCLREVTIAKYRETLAAYVTALADAPLQIGNGPCWDIGCGICPLSAANWRNNDNAIRHGCTDLIGDLTGHTIGRIPNADAKRALARIDEILATYE